MIAAAEGSQTRGTGEPVERLRGASRGAEGKQSRGRDAQGSKPKARGREAPADRASRWVHPRGVGESTEAQGVSQCEQGSRHREVSRPSEMSVTLYLCDPPHSKPHTSASLGLRMLRVLERHRGVSQCEQGSRHREVSRPSELSVTLYLCDPSHSKPHTSASLDLRLLSLLVRRSLQVFEESLRA